MTALDAVAAYLPPLRVPIADLADRLDLSARQVRVFQRFYGLNEVCRQKPDETLTDLLAAVVGELTELRGNEHRVRYVLYAKGMSGNVPYPLNPLHDVCERFGLAHASAFTVSHHACATALLALDMAGRLLTTDGDPDALALVLAGEKTFTRDAELVPETSVFGEGAGACLVSANGSRDRQLSYVTSLRGEFDGRLVADRELATRFAKQYPDLLAEVVQGAIEQAGITLADIGLILPHNVNTVSWQRMCRKIGFPLDRVVLDNVGTTGHNFAADPFINYRTAISRDLLRPGDHYLVAAAGLGATFSAMVFQH